MCRRADLALYSDTSPSELSRNGHLGNRSSLVAYYLQMILRQQRSFRSNDGGLGDYPPIRAGARRYPPVFLVPIRKEIENVIMTFGFRNALSIMILGLLGAAVLMAQSRRPDDLGVGKLLVVPRDFPDPNFAESVVLLVHYGEDGVVGVMINRRTRVPISRVLPELKGANKYSDPVFVGGPVELGVVMALLQSRTDLHDATRVFGSVYLVSTKGNLETALASGVGPNELRIYLGYCGWTRAQLENEVKRGDWYIFDRSEKIVFDSNPSTLWSRMIARTEVRIARLQWLTPAWLGR
jgi:putative transcriptional regulator